MNEFCYYHDFGTLSPPPPPTPVYPLSYPPPPPPPSSPDVLPAYRHQEWQMFMQRCCHSKVLVHDSSQICCLQSITLPLSLTTSGEDRKKRKKGKKMEQMHTDSVLYHTYLPLLAVYLYTLSGFLHTKTNKPSFFFRMKVCKYARTCMIFKVLTADTDFKWGSFI